MAEYLETFNHEKLIVEDFKPYMALVSFANGFIHKGLSEKFVMEEQATLEKASAMTDKTS